MNSIIFRSTARALLPVMLLLSVIILLRGHNEPGGGFVGGLLAAAAFSLYALAFDGRRARMHLRVPPMTLIGAGLLIAAGSGLPGLIIDGVFLRGRWLTVDIPGFAEPLKVGTPLVFDIGVYLLVLGGAVLMVLSLEETRHVADRGS